MPVIRISGYKNMPVIRTVAAPKGGTRAPLELSCTPPIGGAPISVRHTFVIHLSMHPHLLLFSTTYYYKKMLKKILVPH